MMPDITFHDIDFLHHQRVPGEMVDGGSTYFVRLPRYRDDTKRVINNH
jgi:hypothetical protein